MNAPGGETATTTAEPPRLDRQGFFAAAHTAPPLDARSLVDAWTTHVDRWLASLFARAVGLTAADQGGLALVALGGYGRGELCPHSDLDVMLCHDGRDDVAEVAEAVWYPVWDQGEKLGHSVRTTREALSLAADDLDTATSLLDVRHLGGDRGVTDELTTGGARVWEKRGRRWLDRLADSVEARHRRAGEVAFHLDPDLKAGRGGLRDVHALSWASRARQVHLDEDLGALGAPSATLLSARVALQLAADRAGDTLLGQDQVPVAAALGIDADELMARVAAAGRAIAWRSDETWYRVRSLLAGPAWAFGRRDRRLAGGVVLRDGEVHLDRGADPTTDPGLALRAGAAAAGQGTRIDRSSLDRLGAEVAPLGDPWPAGAADDLVTLLSAGRDAVGVIESLDQVGVWTRVLPEWGPVRSCPQRDAYHRFTVDRHLCEAAANAAGLTDRVERGDLLVLGALFHDIGKGRPGDHTDIGMDLVAGIGTRMGLPAADVDVLVAMVRHHLLLPDVATRRDLGDPDTITGVADAVGDPAMVRLLAALCEADSIATGPAAWGRWKASLVAELVARTLEAMGEDAGGTYVARFPSQSQLDLLAAGELVVAGEAGTLTVVAPDRAGTFSRVAGVVALHGLGVLSADAISREGMALSQVRVETPSDEPVDWDRVTEDVRRALSGRLALGARLADRARVYRRRRPRIGTIAPQVHVDNEASAAASVVEVHGPDGTGVLYHLTQALAGLDLDIASAKVQTLGDSVVDSFYVRTAAGAKVTDDDQLAELERALLHALTTTADDR